MSTTRTPTTTTTTTETETTTETTTTPVETAAEHVDAAEEALRTALKTYATFAGSINTTILSVTAATSTFSRSDVLADLDAVRAELDRARELDNGEYGSTITDMQQVVKSIKRMAEAQPHLIEAYAALVPAIDGILDRNYSTSRSHRGTAGRALGAAETNIRVLKSIDPTIADSTDVLSSETFEKKIEQLATEAETFQTVVDLLPKIIWGTNSFTDTVEGAEDPVDRLKEGLAMNGITKTLKNLSPPGYFSGKLGGLSCYTGAIGRASTHLKKALETHDEETAEEELQKTREALDSCGHTKDLLSN